MEKRGVQSNFINRIDENALASPIWQIQVQLTVTIQKRGFGIFVVHYYYYLFQKLFFFLKIPGYS